MSEEDNGTEIGGSTEYPYSVKIAQTALGARVSVHAYAHNESESVESAINLYHYVRKRLNDLGFKIAPEEPAAKKVTKE